VRRKAGEPDARTIIAPLDLQLRNPGFAGELDQLADFIDCHQWISLAESLIFGDNGF
jgi:hypothetical protein